MFSWGGRSYNTLNNTHKKTCLFFLNKKNAPTGSSTAFWTTKLLYCPQLSLWQLLKNNTLHMAEDKYDTI